MTTPDEIPIEQQYLADLTDPLPKTIGSQILLLDHNLTVLKHSYHTSLYRINLLDTHLKHLALTIRTSMDLEEPKP